MSRAKHPCVMTELVCYDLTNIPVIIWKTYVLLYYTIIYYTILYYTTLHYTILYYTILCYTILYYAMLYYKTLKHSVVAVMLQRSRDEKQLRGGTNEQTYIYIYIYIYMEGLRRAREAAGREGHGASWQLAYS